MVCSTRSNSKKWKQIKQRPFYCPPVQELLANHGVVCITRNGSNAAALLERPGTLLHTYRSSVSIVQEPVLNDISSSKVGGSSLGW